MRITTTKCGVRNDCQKYVIKVTGITIRGKMNRFNEVRMRPTNVLNHWCRNGRSAAKRSILVSASTIFDVPNYILETLMDLQQKIHAALSQEVAPVLMRECGGGRGRPKFIVSEEILSRLIEMSIPVSCIANILGIMYLEPATNNRSSTALSFFLQSVQKHG
ncbi:unnamed protein product [Leuciscus chuanchicus]